MLENTFLNHQNSYIPYYPFYTWDPKPCGITSPQTNKINAPHLLTYLDKNVRIAKWENKLTEKH